MEVARQLRLAAPAARVSSHAAAPAPPPSFARVALRHADDLPLFVYDYDAERLLRLFLDESITESCAIFSARRCSRKRRS